VKVAVFILSVLIMSSVQAVIFDPYVTFIPSLDGKWTVNETMYVYNLTVNETCVILNGNDSRCGTPGDEFNITATTTTTTTSTTTTTLVFPDLELDNGLEWVEITWLNVTNLSVFISEDNSTWERIQFQNNTNKSAYNLLLKEDTTYYLYYENGSMTKYEDFTTQSVYESEKFQFLTVMLLFSLGLLLCYYFIQDTIFPVFSGMVFLFIGIDLVRNGFPNIYNGWLLSAVSILLIGFSFILMLVPALNKIEVEF